MRVVIFGAGYVGLVQAAVLAEIGHSVVCVDVNVERVGNLQKGIIPIFEPGLESLIKEGLESRALAFTSELSFAFKDDVDAVFIAVGTPPDEDGSADLKYVKEVAKTVACHVKSSTVLITKSTVPVTTGDQLEEIILPLIGERNSKGSAPISICVVSNPEFLKEGSALADCRRPDRIIIGSDDKVSIDVLKRLYAPLNRNHDKIIVMGRRDAEFTKYASNCMLATKISFINEMSQIAMKMGVDIESVRKGIGADPRIGYQFIYPGCGYGGSCFPKDVSALIRSSQHVGLQPELLQAVEKVNGRQKQFLPSMVKRLLGEHCDGRVVAVWGLSFKPNTDDVREAPSIHLINSLLASGAKVQAFDPEAMHEFKRICPASDLMVYMENRDSCLDGADALVICTEWKAFQVPDLSKFKSSLSTGVIIDGRNLYDPSQMKEAGLRYYGVARGESINI